MRVISFFSHNWLSLQATVSHRRYEIWNADWWRIIQRMFYSSRLNNEHFVLSPKCKNTCWEQEIGICAIELKICIFSLGFKTTCFCLLSNLLEFLFCVCKSVPTESVLRKQKNLNGGIWGTFIRLVKALPWNNCTFEKDQSTVLCSSRCTCTHSSPKIETFYLADRTRPPWELTTASFKKKKKGRVECSPRPGEKINAVPRLPCSHPVA